MLQVLPKVLDVLDAHTDAQKVVGADAALGGVAADAFSNGEVAWPDEHAEASINVMTAAGHVQAAATCQRR